jgi:GT2 family glycosyltransferase
MIPILGIPILNRPDLLQRLIQSIDYPVEVIYIINNSAGKDQNVSNYLNELPSIIFKTPVKQLLLHYPNTNLGVAGSWNNIISRSSALYQLICGNDIMFHPGDLEKIDTFVTKNMHDHAVMYAHGHNCFAITRYGLTTVGNFDENIYPAYLEDCDHDYRVKLAGVKTANIPDVDIIHGEAPTFGSTTIYSNPIFSQRNAITHGNNFKYYFAKWGGINGEEKFTHPFNDLGLDLKYWLLNPEWRIQNDIWFK